MPLSGARSMIVRAVRDIIADGTGVCDNARCTYPMSESCGCGMTARAAISAHLEALKAAGWVVVPIEPTPEMIESGCMAIARLPRATLMGWELAGNRTAMPQGKMRARWDAMLSAAPPAQNGDE